VKKRKKLGSKKWIATVVWQLVEGCKVEALEVLNVTEFPATERRRQRHLAE